MNRQDADSEPLSKKPRIDNARPELGPEQLARLCYSTYRSLPGKSGKANSEGEFTILAAIVCETDQTEPAVVALASGTKCFPENVSQHDCLIVDCHAEPLVKRAFKCHLLTVLRAVATKKVDVLAGKAETLYDSVFASNRYTLFVSQTPCGTRSRWKGEGEVTEDEPELRHYKSVGVNRKPGRGPLCPAAGCIHKIARWCHLGLQGRRLYGILGKRIPIHRIVIGSCESTPDDILERMLDRIVPEEFSDQSCDQNDDIFASSITRLSRLQQAVEFHEVDLMREVVADKHPKSVNSGEESAKRRPAGNSLVAWRRSVIEDNLSGLRTQNGDFDVERLAAGRKQGSSKKSPPGVPTSRICNKALDKQIDELETVLAIDPKSVNERIEQYEDRWKKLKDVSIFRGWPQMEDSVKQV